MRASGLLLPSPLRHRNLTCFKRSASVDIGFMICRSLRRVGYKLHKDSMGSNALPISYSAVKPCFVGASAAGEDGRLWKIEKNMCIEELNDFFKELEELFFNVKTMVKMGKKEDAVELLEANYEYVKEQIYNGFRDIEQAALLDVIALGYVAVGYLDIVEHILGMLSEIMACIPNDRPSMDSILLHMGSMYINVGKLEDAKHAYMRGLHVLEDLFGSDSPFLVAPLLGMANVLKVNKKITEAIEIYNRSISILEMSRGPLSEDLVLPLFGIGSLFIDEGRATDAKLSYGRILNIYTQLYGKNDGKVGMAMCCLAHANCAEGNINEAIHLYENGLHIIKDSKYMAIHDDLVEKMTIDLAELLHVAGREHEGRELLEECLLVMEKYKGYENPSSVTHLVNLASSYSRSKNFVEAERLLRTSLQILSRTVGFKDQAATVPMLHLAVVLYHLDRNEESEKLALEALCIREAVFGKQSLPVGEALDCLISIQTRLGKADGEILSHLWRVLAIQEEAFGSESDDIMTTLKKLIFYLDKMGRSDEKLPLQRRLTMLGAKSKQKVPF